MNQRVSARRDSRLQRTGRVTLGLVLTLALSLSIVPAGAHAESPSSGPGGADPAQDESLVQTIVPEGAVPETGEEETEGATPEPGVDPEVPSNPQLPEEQEAEEQEQFGANGGVVSNSPGPADALEGVPTAPRALAAAGRALIGDNYPAKYKNLPMYPIRWDEWNFAHRQCTSFVAWRLNSANKVPFSNQYKGLWAWGNAGEWAAAARSVGIKVDTKPEVGAVAWSGAYYGGASEYGHVAWVADVLADGRVVIEEYNYGWAGSYYSRTVPANAFQGYIHIADLQSSFTKSPKPTIIGVPMVNGTLSAGTSGWAPVPESFGYQWLRNGAPISGATRVQYQPTMEDLGKSLSVQVTATRAKYRTTTVISTASAAVMMSDLNGNGVDDGQEIEPWNTDVNGDGLPDVVGFGSQGVSVALRTSTGLDPAKLWCSCFGSSAGWLPTTTSRALVDLNGDGKADVAGFASDGVYVALSTGTGFAAPQRWTTDFGGNAGWNTARYPRTLGDVNGDGRPDILAFASDGVYVALNRGSSFAKMSKWYDGFNAAKGWSVESTPRFFLDVNGDGRTDVVGISNAGVYVALSTGGGFATARQWTAEFRGADGWRIGSTPRTLADVTGDGLPDLVGFATDGVYVARNTGTGFASAGKWSNGFGRSNGWLTGEHPRVLADVDGDGLADLVGFGAAGVSVALSTGNGFGGSTLWSTEFNSASWNAGNRPRLVTDLNGDGRADLVGFDLQGVRVSLSDGRSFRASKIDLASMGQDAGGWRVATHLRGVGIRTLAPPLAPTISGQVRVGEELVAKSDSWSPSPVALTGQWLRDGKSIAGASSQTYRLTPADLGSEVSYRVRGTKNGFAARTVGSQKYLVAPGIITPGTVAVKGAPRPGESLRAVTVGWRPNTVFYSYQWLRNGAVIPGANKAEYVIKKDDVGRRIAVRVTASQQAFTSATNTSSAMKISGVPARPSSPPFADVPRSHKFGKEIDWMYSAGISRGTSQQAGKPTFGPSRAVSREAMAAFLFRVAGDQSYQAPRTSPFVDVTPSHQFYREIAWMWEQGISTGSSGSSGRVFYPKSPVTREAMAAFLFRLEAPSFRAPSTSVFADVSLSDRFFSEIMWMYESKLSTGVAQPDGLPRYSPKSAVSREAMAAFLYRLETGV